MRSHSTRELLAGVAIAQQFGRPGTPADMVANGRSHVLEVADAECVAEPA